MKIKIVIVTALLGVLFCCSLFSTSDFTFTEIATAPVIKTMLGTYFLFMGYQLISPYPIVFEVPLPKEIAGLQYGPLILVSDELNNTDMTVAHELEHLYQETVVNFSAFLIVRMVDYFRAQLEGNWYDDSFFEILATRAQFRIYDDEPMLYWLVELEF